MKEHGHWTLERANFQINPDEIPQFQSQRTITMTNNQTAYTGYKNVKLTAITMLLEVAWKLLAGTVKSREARWMCAVTKRPREEMARDTGRLICLAYCTVRAARSIPRATRGPALFLLCARICASTHFLAMVYKSPVGSRLRSHWQRVAADRSCNAIGLFDYRLETIRIDVIFDEFL